MQKQTLDPMRENLSTAILGFWLRLCKNFSKYPDILQNFYFGSLKNREFRDENFYASGLQFMRGLALIPLFTASSPFALLQNQIPPIMQVERFVDGSTVRDDRASRIDAYFAKRNMPLAGYGAKMVALSEENNIDWRLLPAIAIKESTGGKFACGNNPFGWGSCKIKFSTYDAAIEAVARNLGGNNPNTERYYKNKTLIEKLHNYNNSVVPTYTAEILGFMDLIEKEGQKIENRSYTIPN